MVMKNYAKYLIGIGIITITIFVWYSQYSDLNTIDYQIFKYERGYFCNKIITHVNKQYQIYFYTKQILQSCHNLYLYFCNKIINYKQFMIVILYKIILNMS